MSKIRSDEHAHLTSASFGFPEQRKLPLEDAGHVRNAIARFNQVKGVTDSERDAAWKKVEAAAKKHGVELSESSWRALGDH